jgi:hypothetical protein
MSKVKTCYNLDLLKVCIERDSPKDVEIPDKLNRDVKIKFTCPCGSEGLCSFRYIYKIGLKCHECKKIIGKEKIIQTNLKNYGAEHHNQTILGKEIRKQTNLKNLGVENPFQSKEIKEKIRQTNLKNHGAEYHTQTESGKEKIRQSNIRNHGVANVFQSKKIKDKIKQTNLKNHGAEYHTQTESGKEKVKQSNIKNHGVANVFQSKEIKDKIKKGFLDTYGVEHPQQVPEIFEKSQKTAHKLKPYIFPSGKEVKIQGYENHALDRLLQTYQEDDLTIGASLVPKIIYTLKEKSKRYYPDIYILKDNLIIEVKSTYTMNKELDKNLAKRKACIEQGYDFKFWIFARGQLIQEINKDEDYIKSP